MEFPKELRLRLLKLKKVISTHFNESNWLELGLFVGCSDIIDGEYRLLQSLKFNDDDYDGHVVSVLNKIARKNSGLIDDIEKYVSSVYSANEVGSDFVGGIMFEPKVFSVSGLARENDLVALMMPFAAEFDGVSDAVKRAAGFVGMRCARVSDIWENSTIIQDIFSLIYRARIVICDFSGRNANVFYEAGIAHTLGRDVVPIVQNPSDIPFDVQHHRFLKYLPNEQGLEELSASLAERIGTLIRR